MLCINVQRVLTLQLSTYRQTRIRSVSDFARRLRQLLVLLFHPSDHRIYVQETNGYIDRGIARDGFFQRHKYLGDYLARSLTPNTRRHIILSHYRFVGKKVADPALREIIDHGIVLWEQVFDAHRATILLSRSELGPMEGEWQLQFMLDDLVLCTLSFVFASMPHFDPDREVVCLIGGIQGGLDCRSAIRIAAKANHEIAPTTMLILAVKATAQALGAGAVYGVCSRDRIAEVYAADRITADYDAIWHSLGATRRAQACFNLSHGLIERDLSDIPLSHRRRTKLKRRRKAAMLIDMTLAAKRALLG